MKVGDLVRCKDENRVFDIDSGIGIVIQVDEWDPDALSVCVQWTDDYLWYHLDDLEVINENR